MKKQGLILVMIMLLLNGCGKEINNVETVENNEVLQKEDFEKERTEEKDMEATIQDFTAGEWVRADMTGLDGVVIDVKWNKENGTAIIKDVSDTLRDYGFEINNIKWKNIKVIDSATVQFEDLSKGDESNYLTAMGLIDYENSIIQVNVSESSGDYYSNGQNQVWIKKSYLEDNKKAEITLDEILDTDNEDIKNIEKDNFVEDGLFIGTYKGEDNNKLITKRGIQIGSSREDVISQYGLQHICMGTSSDYLLAMKNDDLGWEEDTYNSFMDTIKQSKYYYHYTGLDKKQYFIRFYFDSEDKVSLIFIMGNYNNLMEYGEYNE